MVGQWHAGRVRVLVVEDEASLRDGIVDLLTGDDQRVLDQTAAGLTDPRHRAPASSQGQVGQWHGGHDSGDSASLLTPARGQCGACDARARQLFLSRAGAIATPFTVRTTSASRVLPTGATGGVPAYVAATLPASDPLLDAIAFSRGRFVLDQAGAPPLVLPVWAEIGRVIEDCRG